MVEYSKRILDEKGIEITNPDLTVGHLFSEYIVKDNATPVDNITKFAWDDDDYEDIYRYVLSPQETLDMDRIEILKRNLSETDYISMKVLEGVSTWDDYPGIKEKRQQWRDEINKLESNINA